MRKRSRLGRLGGGGEGAGIVERSDRKGMSIKEGREKGNRKAREEKISLAGVGRETGRSGKKRSARQGKGRNRKGKEGWIRKAGVGRETRRPGKRRSVRDVRQGTEKAGKGGS